MKLKEKIRLKAMLTFDKITLGYKEIILNNFSTLIFNKCLFFFIIVVLGCKINKTLCIYELNYVQVVSCISYELIDKCLLNPVVNQCFGNQPVTKIGFKISYFVFFHK